MYKDFAIDLAKKSGAIMRKSFTIGMRKEWKNDATPVTATDIAINQLVIDSVSKNFPDHGVIGEEISLSKKSSYQWVCDPVDGTIPFSHGVPTFVFMLALVKNGESELGVLYDPLQNRLCVAEKGKGATLNDRPMRVSNKKSISPYTIISLNGEPQRQRILSQGAWVPVLYSVGYESMLVACGEYDGVVYQYNNPWDGAAVKILIEEAGGKVTDLAGNEQRYDQKINGFIASNGLIHNDLVTIMQKHNILTSH